LFERKNSACSNDSVFNENDQKDGKASREQHEQKIGEVSDRKVLQQDNKQPPEAPGKAFGEGDPIVNPFSSQRQVEP